MLVSLLQPSSQMMMTMQTPRKRWSFLRGSHHFRERRPTLHHTARVYYALDDFVRLSSHTRAIRDNDLHITTHY